MKILKFYIIKIQVQRSQKMESSKYIRPPTTMASSMMLHSEVTPQSPSKKAFSPHRPLYQLYIAKKQNKLPSIKSYTSFEKRGENQQAESSPQQLTKSAFKGDSGKSKIESILKAQSNKIKLLNIKEKYHKDSLDILPTKLEKKYTFQNLHSNIQNLDGSAYLKDLELVIKAKQIKPEPTTHPAPKPSQKEQKFNQYKTLLINNKRETFEVIKFIDEGSYGKVHLVHHEKTQALYCLKSIQKDQLDETCFNQLVRESIIQSYLNHPNIVNLYAIAADADHAYLLLEACPGQNLYKRLKSHPFKEKDVRKIIKEVCGAVEYMHKNDIIHRDIKPENIIIHENTIKICDFGWAIHSPLLRNTQCGTPLYTPPEIVKEQFYDSKIDIWCIGVLTFELLFGTIPFEIRHPNDLSKIVSEDVYFPKDVPVTDEAKHFILKCLEKNASERYNIRQALADGFLVNKIETYRHTLS